MAVNYNHVIYLTKALLPQLKRRAKEKKVGIMITGSSGANGVGPGLSIYSSAKRGVRLFGQALRFELKSYKIEVSVYEPGEVKTKMLPTEVPIRTISTYQSVQGALKDMGREEVFTGNGRHDTIVALFVTMHKYAHHFTMGEVFRQVSAIMTK